MSDKFLHRDDAPFSEKVWEKIDQAVVEAAKGQLSARRLLRTEGPYGLGFKSLPGPDREIAETAGEGVTLVASSATPVAAIQSAFTLSARDVAAFEETGLPLDLRAAVAAALSCARQEDALLFSGAKALGVEGLLTAKGTQSLKLKPWDEVGAAANDLIQAVTVLDKAGFHGPYALALTPSLYNLLFRRYPQGDATEMEHVRTIVSDGVAKAPAINAGGVLVASGRQFASIVLGQDLMTAFVGPSGRDYELVVSESLALRLAEPAAVCVLK
ncbi:MAG: family 1 encapsulin nanocompartment shell protein [bacterium]|nr:family 1 encapsulin nanocompartment shell protein [bacterium]